MSRILRKAIALIAALALLTGTAFADASIVSPVADSVVYSDSLLISVKLTGSESVTVTVYKEYYESAPAVYELVEDPNTAAPAGESVTAVGTDANIETSAPAEPAAQEQAPEFDPYGPDGGSYDVPALKGENEPATEASGNAQTPSEKAPDAIAAPDDIKASEPAQADPAHGSEDAGPVLVSVLVSEAEYSPYDASSLTESDLSLLSSGKTKSASGEALTLSDGKDIPVLSDVVFAPSVSYSSDSEVGFYTKKLSAAPGLYRVEVKDRSGNVSSSFVAVKEKPQEEKAGIFSGSQQKSGAFSFLKNVLKSLFR